MMRRLSYVLALLAFLMPTLAWGQQADLSGVGSNVKGKVEGRGSSGFSIEGAFVGTLTFQASAEDTPTHWHDMVVCASDGSAGVVDATAPGLWSVDVSGYKWVRVITAAGLTGSAHVIILGASPTGRAACKTNVTFGTIDNNIVGPLDGGRVAVALPTGQSFYVVPAPTNGAKRKVIFTAASTNAQVITANPANLYKVIPLRIVTGKSLFLFVWDTAGSPTCNDLDDTPHLLGVYPLTEMTGSGGIIGMVDPMYLGIKAVDGIAVCVTTSIAGTGNTAVNDGVIMIDYQD